jgi:xylulokinase
MSTLGLDIGTTGCKAAVFDAHGKLLASAYREYPLIFAQPGWAELDSDRVCDLAMEVIAETAAACPADPVQAVGVSCQGEAFTPVDRNGRALGYAMVSSDSRAASYTGEWSRQFGVESLYRITGHTPHPMFSLFKLLWTRDHRPDVWRAADKWLCFEDLFCLRLGLPPTMGYPLAGRTMLFNVRTHVWDARILDAVGLTPDRLARPIPAGSISGTIPPETARRLGLAQGAILIAGGHDQPCNAIGAGAVRNGVAMYGAGTVECVCPAFDRAVFDPALMRSNLCTYDFTIPGMYTTVAFSLTGGNLLKWYRDEWCAAEKEQAARDGTDVYELILRQLGDQPSPVLVLPYFTPSGTPYFDTETPGVLYGLRLSTRRSDVLRGLMEGVALEMRLNLETLRTAGVPIHELRAVGGGARNPALLRLKASVMGTSIVPVTVTEAGCLGMALLAYAAREGAPVVDLVSRWIRPLDPVAPDPALADHYARRFEEYRLLYASARELAARLQR